VWSELLGSDLKALPRLILLTLRPLFSYKTSGSIGRRDPEPSGQSERFFPALLSEHMRPIRLLSLLRSIYETYESRAGAVLDFDVVRL
jgi:hypothetical protein